MIDNTRFRAGICRRRGRSAAKALIASAVDVSAGRRHDKRRDDRNIVARPDSAAGNLGNAWIMRERGFDFLRRNAIAERIHDVVGAAEVGQIPVGIDHANVAADEPVAAM